MARLTTSDLLPIHNQHIGGSPMAFVNKIKIEMVNENIKYTKIPRIKLAFNTITISQNSKKPKSLLIHISYMSPDLVKDDMRMILHG